jgi:ketosteroid isomerase-like protein
MREPLEVVRLAYEAFSYGDWKTAQSMVDPKVEWSLLRHRPDVDPYAEGVGPTGLLSFWASVFRKYRVRPRAYVPRGDHVVVPLDLHGRGGQGAEHLEEVWSVRVTGGKIRSVHEFATVEEALEAADSSVDPRRAR